MKKPLLVLVLGVAAGFSVVGSSFCYSPASCAAQKIDALRTEYNSNPSKFLSDENMKEFCAKKPFTGLTVRSYNGEICKQSKFWAAVAEAYCGIDPTYNQSQCHGHAKKFFPNGLSKIRFMAEEKLGTIKP